MVSVSVPVPHCDISKPAPMVLVYQKLLYWFRINELNYWTEVHFFIKPFASKICMVFLLYI